MPILTVDDISKNFGERDVLSHVSFTVNEGDKIAFIGNNGAGKSTLFRIVKGTERADNGRIILHGNTIVGFLSQNMDEQDMASDGLMPRELKELEERKFVLENDIACCSASDGAGGEAADVPDLSQRLDELMREYTDVCAAFEAKGGYDYEYRMNEALAGLGLTGLDSRSDLTTLSGGEKMRVCLAGLIVARPDILMLDEPTNHLDTEAIEWLENFLTSYKGSVFIISHDRYFINRIANRVIELDNGRITCYKGNYDEYREQKENFLKTQTALVRNLEEELAHQVDVKQTMLSHRNISGYHQREKMVDKLADILARERARLPGGQGKMSFNVVPAERTGASDKLLLEVKGVSKRFDDCPMLFSDVNFEVKAGEKIFLCGPNGCGKTTLLSMLLGKAGGFDGTVYVSSTASMGYMEQFVPFADEEATLFDELISRSDLGRTEARSLLARFGFREDDVFKKIKVLSGGERSRLYLCCLLEEKPEILFLDEPTNHLDIESREILEDALKEYNGAIVCVSHDRFFIEKCADRILGFGGGSAKIYDNYYKYRRALKGMKAEGASSEDDALAAPARGPASGGAAAPAQAAVSEPASTAGAASEAASAPASSDRKPSASGLNPAQERKAKARRMERIRTIETEIASLEAAQKELEDGFATTSGQEQYQIYAENAARLEELYEEYMELADE